MTTLFLLCNAHIDPVWQWEWEEGAAATVSTFRAAADFCEEYDSFVFNHNEALLYRWIEEYEPPLFRRIQKLVAAGRWHIMGGWYLQPDCNMPCGESFVRQILYGRRYFAQKFGALPTTAMNVDSFGHSRGLVQILRKAGYDSYIYMRPEDEDMPHDFRWIGFDGSEVLVHRIWQGYNTLLGQAHTKIAQWIKEVDQTAPDGLLLWGVGNHGGGPSRLDLDQIGAMMPVTDGITLTHATPEQYFASVAERAATLPQHAGDLNPRFVGCYTSVVRIKQQHRRLENELFAVEKMLSSAALQGLLTYPAADMHAAFHDLMFSQFHDILPGTLVQPAEEAALRLLSHGLEITARLRARAFFTLASGQAPARDGEYPILIYNPHPFAVQGVFACEFMLADQNWHDEFSLPLVFDAYGNQLPAQAEKEMSNLSLDWRKRVVFAATLQPSQMNRFNCRMQIVPERPRPHLYDQASVIRFTNKTLEVVINTATGLLDTYAVGGVPFLAAGACQPLIIADTADPWRMDTNRFEPVIGAFQLMSAEDGSAFSGVQGQRLPSVRVIEEGAARTVVEALFSYGASSLVMTYKLPTDGNAIEIELRVFWAEKDTMLKLALPTVFQEAQYLGQTAFGVQRLHTNGSEMVAHKWVAAVDTAAGHALTVSNDGIYGSDFQNGAVRLTLLRSPGYAAHPILERPLLVQDRFLPRIDQGERMFTVRVQGGDTTERLAQIDREALVLGEKPYALSFFPSAGGTTPLPALILMDDVVQLVAFKQAEDGNGFVVRLFSTLR